MSTSNLSEEGRRKLRDAIDVRRRRLTDQTIRALVDKGVSVQCPRCGNERWNVEIGAVVTNLLPTKDARLLQKSIPAAAVTCDKCGFMALHNLDVLGVER